MKNIHKITAADTFVVRHPVLREDKPRESCRFEGDDLATTTHFGLFVDHRLAGVASVFESSSLQFPEKTQFQLRGMAVLEQHRKKGFGEDLLRHAETYVKSLNGEILWFNARIVAVPFYERCGYKIVGEGFAIGDIGQHFVMFKRL